MTVPGKSPEKGTFRDKPLIYVVDDEPLVAEVVETILDLDGYKTRVFLEPREALEALLGEGVVPDLLLTDYRMPDLTGMELIRLAKERFPELKTILFSGYVEANVFDNQTVKPDLFVRKPFYADSLLENVRLVIGRDHRAR